MRIFLAPLWCSLLLTWSTVLFAQSEKTYSLVIHALATNYHNTFGPVVSQSIKDQWLDWQQADPAESEYIIRVKFLQGLKPRQYTRKKVAARQYIYDVKYDSPRYEAQVTDKQGQLLLQKAYGGQPIISRFGAEDKYASPDTLAEAWVLHRDAFYELEEAKYNNVDELLSELSAILNNGAVPIVEPIETIFKNPETTPSALDIPTLEENEPEEKVVLSFVESESYNNEITNEPAPESVVQEQQNSLQVAEQTNETQRSKTSPQTPILSEEETAAQSRTVESPTTDTNTASVIPEEESAPSVTNTTNNPVADNSNPEPQLSKTDTVIPEKPKETDAERAARLERIQKEWEELDKAEEEKNKKPRVRYVRLGIRSLLPNIVGGHGEVVLPVLTNRVSLVADFSQLNFGSIVDPFLNEGTSLENIDVIYRYYSFGGNYYFRKKYARGWYLGASYLKNIGRTEVKDVAGPPLKAEVNLESVALRLGLNTGLRTFMFGFEVGAGLPMSNLKGGVYSQTDGETKYDVVDERVPVVPVFNITIGVAL